MWFFVASRSLDRKCGMFRECRYSKSADIRSEQKFAHWHFDNVVSSSGNSLNNIIHAFSRINALLVAQGGWNVCEFDIHACRSTLAASCRICKQTRQRHLRSAKGRSVVLSAVELSETDSRSFQNAVKRPNCLSPLNKSKYSWRISYHPTHKLEAGNHEGMPSEKRGLFKPISQSNQ
jgi:hypothetical protein